MYRMGLIITPNLHANGMYVKDIISPWYNDRVEMVCVPAVPGVCGVGFEEIAYVLLFLIILTRNLSCYNDPVSQLFSILLPSPKICIRKKIDSE